MGETDNDISPQPKADLRHLAAGTKIKNIIGHSDGGRWLFVTVLALCFRPTTPTMDR